CGGARPASDRDRRPRHGGRDVSGRDVVVDEPVNDADAAAPEIDEVTDTEPVTGTVDPEAPWERLSWRMLLVDPLSSLTRRLPLFQVSLLLGSIRSNYWLQTFIIELVYSP